MGLEKHRTGAITRRGFLRRAALGAAAAAAGGVGVAARAVGEVARERAERASMHRTGVAIDVIEIKQGAYWALAAEHAEVLERSMFVIGAHMDALSRGR